MGRWWDNVQKIEPTENIGWLDTMRDIGIDVKPPTAEWMETKTAHLWKPAPERTSSRRNGIQSRYAKDNHIRKK